MPELIQISPFRIHGISPNPQGLDSVIAGLKEKGQIEPVRVLRRRNTKEAFELDVHHPDYWIYSDALVVGAQTLHWKTILVSVGSLR